MFSYNTRTFFWQMFVFGALLTGALAALILIVTAAVATTGAPLHGADDASVIAIGYLALLTGNILKCDP